MIRALLVAALLAGCGGSATTGDDTPDLTSGTGDVTFGKGLDRRLRVEQEQDTFALGEVGAFSGSFREPAGATSLEIIISSRDAGGAEGVVYTEMVGISDPEFNTFGVEEIVFSGLVGDEPGDYVLRIYRDATELAEGTFTITQ